MYLFPFNENNGNLVSMHIEIISESLKVFFKFLFSIFLKTSPIQTEYLNGIPKTPTPKKDFFAISTCFLDEHSEKISEALTTEV